MIAVVIEQIVPQRMVLLLFMVSEIVKKVIQNFLGDVSLSHIQYFPRGTVFSGSWPIAHLNTLIDIILFVVEHHRCVVDCVYLCSKKNRGVSCCKSIRKVIYVYLHGYWILSHVVERQILGQICLKPAANYYREARERPPARL